MKYKLLTTTALALFAFSINVSAFKLLSHDFHSSANAHGGFIITKDEVRELPELSKEELKKNNLSRPQAMTVQAKAYSTSGRVSTTIRINSSHRYCLDNYSSQAAQGGYRFSLATMGEDVHSSETFQLGSHQSRCVEANSFMNVYPRSSGDFSITAFTTGQDGYDHRQDRDSATLRVAD